MIDPTRHHGLDIVRAVADEWGIDGDQTTRTIWSESTPRVAIAKPAPGRSDGRHTDAVRIFFTIIKGAPSARQAYGRPVRERTRVVGGE